MTIKEVEALTGMPRASIRFYEAEKLIEPEREKNGYRIYTEENVADLLRIKLLRALDISIEEIREAAAGRLRLSDCLSRRVEQLGTEQAKFERSAEVCRRMLEDGAEFRAMDPHRYLSWLEEGVPALTAAPAPKPEAPCRKPGLLRRYLARSFDFALYGLIWDWVLSAVFRMNLTGGVTAGTSFAMELLENAVVMVLLMLLEPLLLCRWGTTPGKWIMGIRVTDDSGKRLTYREAVSRCWMLLLYGYGLFIPIVVVVRQVKSLWGATHGEEPEWEWYSRLQLREESWLRAAVVWLLCVLLLVAPHRLIRVIPEVPPNRGELTAAEFAENFNTLQRYYENGTNDYIFSGDLTEMSAAIPWQLDASGSWMEREDDGRTYSFVNSVEPPAISFATDADGCVTEIAFSGRAQWISGDENRSDDIFGKNFTRHIFLMRVAALAYVGAQPEAVGLNGSRNAISELVANGWRQDYAFTFRGVTVSYDVEFSNCEPAGNGAPDLTALEGAEEHSVAYTFTMKLAE